jgi:hypothetical protein
MAIAHQSEVLGAANLASGNYDTAITPAAASDAVCVVIVQGDTGGAADLVTSVVYGTGAGSKMLTRLRFDSESTEPGAVYIYWGAGSIPTGTQTVRIARGGTNEKMRCAISTMTVAAGASVAVDVSATGTSASSANPSWTMTTLTANTVCYEGIHSGLQTMVNTPATNWTLGPTPGFEDVAAFGRGWAHRAHVGPSNAAPGWIAATADDFVGSSVAFKEVVMVRPTVRARRIPPPRLPAAPGSYL